MDGICTRVWHFRWNSAGNTCALLICTASAATGKLSGDVGHCVLNPFSSPDHSRQQVANLGDAVMHGLAHIRSLGLGDFQEAQLGSQPACRSSAAAPVPVGWQDRRLTGAARAAGGHLLWRLDCAVRAGIEFHWLQPPSATRSRIHARMMCVVIHCPSKLRWCCQASNGFLRISC